MSKLDTLIREFNRQLDTLVPDGYVLQGSVVTRRLQRPVAKGTKTYGPYYLWTRKINNRTVTTALTAEQAAIIQDALERNKRTENALKKLRGLSEQIIMTVTPSVTRRKRRTARH
jgi:hypothetical protein